MKKQEKPKHEEVIQLSHKKAIDFFLEQKNYFDFELPVYTDFSKLLKKLSKELDKNPLEKYKSSKKKNVSNVLDFLNKKDRKPENFEGVNYTLFINKDGQYAWRPYQIIHPVLYVILVHIITEKKSWSEIQKKFKEFKENKNIKCCSLPIKKAGRTKDVNKEVIIHKWIEEIEEKSIELALDYNYIYHVDIADCFGSIYTHSIAWALHGRHYAKNNRKEINLGNTIDYILRAMSHGQTNGIPQGNTLMTLIAELVLGYADELLTERLEETQNSNKKHHRNYKILRYRDDYRIFVNSPQIGDNIIKLLAEELARLGFKLNAGKTVKSDNVIKDSVKPDKLYWNINHKQLKSAKTIRDKLYLINDLAEKYPNSGNIKTQFSDLYKKIMYKKNIGENIKTLISIVINIAIKNPSILPKAIQIVSKFISLVEKEDEIPKIICKIKTKFDQVPNNEFLQIWLQRLIWTQKYTKIIKKYSKDELLKYEGSFCKEVEVVYDKDKQSERKPIWCSEWLNEDFKTTLEKIQIINRKKLEHISKEEVGDIFDHSTSS